MWIVKPFENTKVLYMYSTGIFFSKLTIKTPEQCKKSVQSALERLNDVILIPLLSIFNFELISHIVLCLQYSL